MRCSIMPETPRPGHSDRVRRWLGLVLGIGMCLLVLSFHRTDIPRQLWSSILQFSAALAFLGTGIYEFVRRDNPK